MKCAIYNTKIGKITIGYEGDFITKVEFGEKENNNEPSLISDLAYQEIFEYLNGERKKFTIKLKIEGTEFQKLVWNELLKIPYGELVSYEEIAKKIGKPKAYRAVGNANNKNKIAIIIPCHRVIGKRGSLVGYASGLNIKKRLIDIERENYNN